MAVHINEQRMRDRHDTFLMDHYATFYMTLVNVSLAIGGLAVARLITLPDIYAIPSRLAILTLLLAVSWTTVLITYSGAAAGVALLPGRLPTAFDILPPFGIGAAQFTMFALLTGQPNLITENEQDDKVAGALVGTITEGWLWTYVVWAICAMLAMQRARHLINDASKDGIYSDQVKKLAKKHAGYQCCDSLFCGLTAVLAFFAATRFKTPSWRLALVGAILLLLLFGVLLHSLRTHWERIGWRALLFDSPNGVEATGGSRAAPEGTDGPQAPLEGLDGSRAVAEGADGPQAPLEGPDESQAAAKEKGKQGRTEKVLRVMEEWLRAMEKGLQVVDKNCPGTKLCEWWRKRRQNPGRRRAAQSPRDKRGSSK